MEFLSRKKEFCLVLMVVVVLLACCVQADRPTRRQGSGLVLAFATAGAGADSKNAHLDELRDRLNLRTKSLSGESGGLAAGSPSLPSTAGLTKELADTLKYLEDIEKERVNLINAAVDVGSKGFLKGELINKTLTEIESNRSRDRLQLERERLRSFTRMGRQGALQALRLNGDYVRGSAYDTENRMQNARHEATGERARSNADARDTVLDQRGKRYEARVEARTRQRNNLQAARTELISSSMRANSAIHLTNREDAIKRRIERLNRLAKARQAYAAVLINKDLADSLTLD